MTQQEQEKKYGRYNDLPANFREITEGEFAHSHFFSYDAEFQTTRHPWSSDPAQMAEIGKYNFKSTLKVWFYWDGTGLAMAQEYWDNKIRYFAFGCEHDYKELSAAEARKEGVQHYGKCWHVNKCQKCGHVHSVDSSD